VVQRESFIFCHYLWISWHRGFDAFSMATTKCTTWPRLQKNGSRDRDQVSRLHHWQSTFCRLIAPQSLDRTAVDSDICEQRSPLILGSTCKRWNALMSVFNRSFKNCAQLLRCSFATSQCDSAVSLTCPLPKLLALGTKQRSYHADSGRAVEPGNLGSSSTDPVSWTSELYK